jgi:preprotein translocase SecF subunit
MALGLGVLGILIYVTMRFEFSFALGAVVALIHDVVITVGVFAIAGRELSLIMVGAILTIAGYSINDTIVVYDRIREGLRSGRKGTIQDIMNASINETLSRTLLTSGCTLLSVAALFLFGGPVLHDFAFAILIGVVVGTYSSIFIASPIVLWWSSKKGESLKGEVKKSQATQAVV